MKYTKLPNPSEVWGEETGDKWTPKLFYFYAKLVIGEAMSHLMFPKSIASIVLQLLILVEVADYVSAEMIWIFIGIGIIVIVILGHILTVEGFIKQQAQLQVSQNPDVIETRDNTREILRRL